MSESDDDDTFEYEITIPETTALIQITKAQIVDEIETRVGRPLTDTEQETAWNDFRQSSDFCDVFAETLREQGIPCMGASGLSYRDNFEEDVETAIQDTVDEIFSDRFSDFFGNSLDTIAEEIKVPHAEETAVEEITWTNIESQSQARIQDENVKNGLARYAKEVKQKSIDKWKAHYVNTRILGSAVVLPDGKSKEDLVKHIAAYLG